MSARKQKIKTKILLNKKKKSIPSSLIDFEEEEEDDDDDVEDDELEEEELEEEEEEELDEEELVVAVVSLEFGSNDSSLSEETSPFISSVAKSDLTIDALFSLKYLEIRQTNQEKTEYKRITHLT